MIVYRILQKVLVNHFYKVNAGLFLFVFLVLFGLPYQPLSFHRSIIDGILKSQLFLALVMIGWLLYCFKCIDYINRQIKEPQQNFLFCLNNLERARVLRYFGFVQVLVYLPVLAYALAIVGIALSRGLWGFALEVMLFCAATILLPSRIYLSGIQKRAIVKSFVWPHIFSFRLSKPLFALPLFYLWHERKQMLLVTKFFSLALLYLFINLYEPERYDVRPLLLCLLLVAGSHSAIVFQVRSFEESFLAFSKNLPLSALQRFLGLLQMYLVLMLPELLFLGKGYGVHFGLKDYPQLLLMAIALVAIFHVTLLLEEATMDQFMRVVFAIMAALFFILLYNPGIVLPGAILVLSFALFAAYYYTFERKV